MISRRSICTAGAVALIGLVQSGLAASARAEDPTAYPAIIPSLTDLAIIDTPSPPPGMPATPALPGTRGNHLVWLAPPERRVGKLLVFLATGGFTNIQSEITELGIVPGQLG
jgi:hypothetical protein